jgi:phosphoserine aminotransferase
MISFYPGPSRLYASIPDFMQEAYLQGVLSINHRSPDFVRISRSTIELLRQKLEIPESYIIFYTSSATECWEILAQSLVRRKSFHLYNGAFGEKWLEYTRRLRPDATGMAFGLNEVLPVASLAVDPDAELIALTQSETSNGTAVSNETIRQLRQAYPQKLIAVDATSSMGGVYLDFAQADVWYASVQKCFGLPAGMALLVCSPEAVQRSVEIGENSHYNSLTAMIKNMENYQTTHTPNVLGVYLMMKVMEQLDPIRKIDALTREKAKNWYDFFIDIKQVNLLVENPAVRSETVIALSAVKEVVKTIKQEALAEGLMLGNGYGKWKEETFRIANFPAIEATESDKLKDFLTRFGLKF